jgi:hypothetical protein
MKASSRRLMKALPLQNESGRCEDLVEFDVGVVARHFLARRQQLRFARLSSMPNARAMRFFE